MSTKTPCKDKLLKLPPKPEPPLPSDCCGGGCVPCIYDYYYDALERWEQVRYTLIEKGEIKLQSDR